MFIVQFYFTKTIATMQKATAKTVAFFGARRLLSQTLIAIYRYKEKVVRVDDFYLDTLDYTVENISQIKLFCFH